MTWVQWLGDRTWWAKGSRPTLAKDSKMEWLLKAWCWYTHLWEFLISKFRRVLNIVYVLLGISPASYCGLPTFRNLLSVPSSEAACGNTQKNIYNIYEKFIGNLLGGTDIWIWWYIKRSLCSHRKYLKKNINSSETDHHEVLVTIICTNSITLFISQLDVGNIVVTGWSAKWQAIYGFELFHTNALKLRVL
jgi:hypothetical protein